MARNFVEYGKRLERMPPKPTAAARPPKSGLHYGSAAVPAAAAASLLLLRKIWPPLAFARRCGCDSRAPAPQPVHAILPHRAFVQEA